MNSMSSIGELSELHGVIAINWKIKDFISLSQQIDTQFESAKFYFSGASWQIAIFPNGISRNDSNGWIGLYLRRMSTGSPITLSYKITLATIDGKFSFTITGENEFGFKTVGWGHKKVLLRSAVIEKIVSPTASDILIVTCAMKNIKSHNLTESLFNRHQSLSDSLKEVFEKRKKTDCSFIVDGVDLSAHQMILEARSPVFQAMFNHDMQENQTGQIVIDDIEKSTMESILMFMYTGDINILTKGNVLSLYAAAEKYDIKEVKQICSEFIMRNLSDEWVLDVIQFNELYKNENIRHCAGDYFKENVRKIQKNAKWKTFAERNPKITIDLLTSVVNALVPE